MKVIFASRTIVLAKNIDTVDSLYLELARDQRICSRQREFEIEKEKQVAAYTKGPRLQFEIERGSWQRVFKIERVDCMHLLLLPTLLSKKKKNSEITHIIIKKKFRKWSCMTCNRESKVAVLHPTERGSGPYKSRFLFLFSSTYHKYWKLGQYLEIDDRRSLSKFGDVT